MRRNVETILGLVCCSTERYTFRYLSMSPSLFLYKEKYRAKVPVHWSFRKAAAGDGAALPPLLLSHTFSSTDKSFNIRIWKTAVRNTLGWTMSSTHPDHGFCKDQTKYFAIKSTIDLVMVIQSGAQNSDAVHHRVTVWFDLGGMFKNHPAQPLWNEQRHF